MKINQDSWNTALVNYQRKHFQPKNLHTIDCLIRIQRTNEILKSDLSIVDDFYPYLKKVDEESAKELRSEVAAKFDYQDA